MKLSYEDIEIIRDTLVLSRFLDPEQANTLCDMAARCLDLEYEFIPGSPHHGTQTNPRQT